MGKKIKKSTAKFKKDHLSRVIAERRFDKKRKRKDLERDQKREAHQEQEKEQQQVAQEIEEDVQKAAPKSLGDLSVDEFMSGKFFDDDTEDVDVDDDDDVNLDDDVEIKQDQEDDDENEDDEANLDDEISSHKQTLSQLETLDPEFYKFMQENSSDLLNFEDDSDEEVVEEEKTAPPTKKDTKSDKKQKQKDKDETIENVYDSSFKVLTPSTLKFLQDQTVQGSVRALKRLCKIFRAACHLGDEDDKKNQSSQSSDEIRITNSTLFNDVMRFAFRHMGIVFRTHFKFTSSTDTNKSITTHPRWDILGPVLKSFLGNCVHFLNQLVEPKMIRFVLTHFESLIPLFEPFPKFINKILKHLLRIWSSSDQNTRIDAFLRIRQMVIELPLKTGIVDMAMKGLYLTYVRNSKFTSPQSIPVIEFCANCVVELYGVETVSSYQHAFVYIRQLAIHLRNAIVNKTKDSYKTVYNWQYINCLRVWSRVLGTHGSSSSAPLHPLVYPFVQICLGVITLLPVTRYFPLRFQVIRFLNQLAEQTHIYIPIASHLIMVLQAAELHKKPGKSTRKAISLNDTLKVSKHVVTTKDFQESIVTTMLELLTTYFTIYSYSIAFPELIVPVKVMLKKYAKSTKIPRIRKQITQVIEKLETNATFITNKRATVNFAPKDMHTKALSGLSSFVPTEENPSASQLSPLARMAALQKKSPQNVVSSSDADWDGSIQKKAEDESKRRKQAGKDSDDEDDDEQDQEMDGEQEEDEDDDEDEDEDEDEDKDSSRRRKKAKTAAPAKSSAKAQSTPARPTKRQQQHQQQDGSDTEDQVQTFVMSDSDDE